MRSLFIVLFALAAAASARAASLGVYPDGRGAYPTIQAAVDAASAGDLIYLMPGTFTGPGNRDVEIDLAITIRSNDVFDPVVIDCQGSAAEPHRAFIIYAGAPVLDHLVVRNGYAIYGGAVQVDGGAPTLTDCVFEDNTADQRGGAVYADGADLVTADHCVFAGNTAAVKGGAVAVGMDIEVRLYSCTLVRNASPDGSAVWYDGNAFCRINSSIIAFGRGGVPIDDYYGAGYVVGCTDIFGNQGGDWVGSMAGQLGVNNNVSVDPILCDPMGRPGNYAVMPASPVGNGFPCGALGAKVPDATWPAPVYGVRADGTGMHPTIQAAVDAVPQPAVIALEDGTYTGTGNRNITLRGKLLRVEGRHGDPATVIIDVEGTHDAPRRGFYLFSGEPEGTTLAGLTIRGGYCNESSNVPTGGTGAGVRLEGTASLRVAACRFEDNTVYKMNIMYAEVGRGGAIHNAGTGALQVEDCTFTGIAADQAVLSDAGPLTVSGSAFAATPSGGLKVGSAAGAVTISGCVFAGFDDTGILCLNVAGELRISDCSFGGAPDGVVTALGVHHCPAVVIERCTLDQLRGSSGILLPSNLVVFNDSHVQLRETVFSNCAGRSILLASEATGGITGCTVTGCSTSSFGGGNLVSIALSDLEVSGCTFTDNDSDIFSTVFVDASTAVFDNCAFTGNRALSGRDVADFSASTVTLRGTRFAGNPDGGVYGENCSLTVTDCTFDGNGGGLRHHGPSLGGVTVTGTSFTNHMGGCAAAVDSMLSRPVVFDRCTFGANSQGLRLSRVPDFRVANTTFSDQADSGALVLEFVAGSLDTCTFARNHAAVDGGAVVMRSGDALVRGCAFTGNSAIRNGGAVANSECFTDFSRCTFDGNTAGNLAGAYLSMYGTTNLNRCDFGANRAGLSGGAIVTYEDEASIFACNVTDCVAATGIGGGASHRYGNTVYSLGSITGNQANEGGGIHVIHGSATLNEVEVARNTAAGAGGIGANDSLLDLNNCTLAGNSAPLASQIGGSYASAVTLTNSILAFGGGGQAAAAQDGLTTFAATGCDVFGNQGGDWVGALAGQGHANCNLGLDPRFCDTQAGDHHLAGDSPCLAANSPCGQVVGALGESCSAPSAVPGGDAPPSAFAVLGNTPNPFNPRTEIGFALPADGAVVIDIHDVTGRRVRRLVQGERFPAGTHRVGWDGTDDTGRAQSSGIYLYRVTAAGRTLGGKMLMIR